MQLGSQFENGDCRLDANPAKISSFQDDIYKAGAIELAGREDEIRMLHLELKKAQYQIEVTKKKCPQVPEMQEQIEELKNEVGRPP